MSTIAAIGTQITPRFLSNIRFYYNIYKTVFQVQFFDGESMNANYRVISGVDIFQQICYTIYEADS